MKNKNNESWDNLLKKPVETFSANEYLEPKIMHVFPSLKMIFKRERGIAEEFMKPLVYLLAGIFYLMSFGDMKKARKLHREKNIMLKLMEKIHRNFRNNALKRYIEGEYVNIKGIRLPIISKDDLDRSVPDEIFKIWIKYNDNYNYKIVNKLDATIGEDPYCYIGPNGEDITIKSGMNVIDAGAWIGDFSAYAVKKGAKVYAFEPSPDTFKWLKKTAEVNKNIIPIQAGTGDKDETLFFENQGDDAGNRFNKKGNIKIKVVSLDNWAKKNKVRVDFIKADIEGFERNMLVGAKNILKRDAPVLSLCTYHLPDDPEIMKKIILRANPKYKIIQRYRKMFAYVDKGTKNE